VLNKAFKLDEIKQQYGDDAGYKVAKFVGEMVPISKAFKIGGIAAKTATGAIAKEGLGQISGAAVRGIATGSLYESYKQAGRTGTAEFDPTSIATTAAMFAVPEVAISGAGVALRNIMGAIRKNPATDLLYKSNDPMKTIVVNDIYANEPKGIATSIQEKFRRAGRTTRPLPGVRQDEFDVIQNIPIEPVPANPLRKVSDAIETGLRMHEKFGTKELMFYPVREANNVADRAIAATEAEANNVIKTNLPFRGRRKASERIYTFAIGQQGGGAAILKNMGIQAPTLTTKEAQVYEYMRGQYDNLFKALNTARTSSGIDPFPKVENYFTFFRNMAGEINDGIPFGDLNFAKLNRTVFRFEKNRIVDNYGALELDAIGGFLRYNRAAQKHIYLTPVVSKLRQLLDGKLPGNFSLREANPYAYNELNGWVNRVAGMPSDAFKVPRGLERGIRQLNRNLMFGVLSYNPRTAAIQPSSIVNTITEIGPKYTMLGVFDFLQNPLAKPGQLFSRELDASISEMANSIRGRVASAQHAVGEFGLKPLKGLDMMTAQITRAGAYRRGLAIYGDVKAAERYADDVVVRTQASAAPFDIAPIQATAVGRLGTAFQTFVINNWGFLTRDVVGIGNPAITNEQAIRKVLTYIAGAQAFNLVYEEGLHMRSPFPSPVTAFAGSMEKDDNLTRAFWSSGTELFDQIPIVGGAFRYGSSPLGAGVQAIGDLARLGRFDMPPGKAIETIGKTVGFPGTVAIRKGIRFLSEEE
jgi:hypothetical protein